jgi:hypothetical protein
MISEIMDGAGAMLANELRWWDRGTGMVFERSRPGGRPGATDGKVVARRQGPVMIVAAGELPGR